MKQEYALKSDIGKDKPMFSLTWFEALMFCNALSKRKGLQPCYELTPDAFRIDASNNEDFEAFEDQFRYWGQFRDIRAYKVKKIENANGYRLPTEAEWEYAALANSTLMLYPQETLEYVVCAYETYENDDGTEEKGIVMANNKTTKPNPWGFYDMLGNTAEFCEDDWDLDPYDFIGGKENELKALLKKKSVDPCPWSEYAYYIDTDGKRQFTKKRFRGLDYSRIDLDLQDVTITTDYQKMYLLREQQHFQKYVGIRLARTIID